MSPDLVGIAARFRLEGEILDAAPYGSGHINDTYAVRCALPGGGHHRYLLQRINHYVFKKPDEVMENVERVTRHLRAKIAAAGGDPERETLNLVPTVDGRWSYRDPAGNTWRVYLFIEGAQGFSNAVSPDHVYAVGRALGKFQRLLADFPASTLHETIIDFHHTARRFAAFVEAVRRDAAGRAASVAEEIRFIEDRAADTGVLVDLAAQGRLPLRVSHYDTKFENVLIDDVTGEGICVIDLDTVMPGISTLDFGDAVRSGAALAAEDEPDAAKAGMSLETFDGLARGYLDAARDFLTPVEIELLAFSSRLITLEQAIRFLGDYLAGDVYYKIRRPDHNLDRARTQIQMVRDMEAKAGQMAAIVEGYC